MEHKSKTYRWMTGRQERLLIENYALLTESAPDLRGRLEEWYAYYQPTTPGECEQMEIAVMSSVQRRRVLAHMTALVNQNIRSAFFDFDRAQEAEVERYRAMLATSPSEAVLGLKNSALGVRFLISRWSRLQKLLHREGTLYGNDRNEMINYQGARATPTESLSQSDGAYLTYLYCLMAQPAPKEKHFVAMGNPAWTPTALYDRDAQDWLGEKPVCQRILAELLQRELTYLEQREKRLRTNYEIPARDEAEQRRQVLEGPEGVRLLRQEQAHGRVFHRAYEAFLKGRLQSIKTGRPPGAPDAGDENGADPQTADVEREAEAQRAAAAEAQARRKREAEAVAPGPDNGIGVVDTWGDVMRERVMEVRPKADAG
jgi:hypothetical protein